MLRITPTVGNSGYWVSADNRLTFNKNLQLALEESSESIQGSIADLQKRIKELRALKSEVDKELKKQGGKFRPRRVRVPVPDPKVWYSTCGICGDSNANLNMVAVETTKAVKVLCRKCGKENFPNLFE